MILKKSLLGLCALALTLPALAAQTFGTADAAGDALVRALETRDRAALQRILGKGYGDLIHVTDQDDARALIDSFVRQYQTRHQWLDQGQRYKVLEVGEENYPFAIPLVKKAAGWEFDLPAGREEMLSRMIGTNELSTIEVLKTLREAQREYFLRNPDGSPFPHYASRVQSSPDTRDGLYWPSAEGEESSPMGELFARAASDMTGKSKPAEPFHGYYFRLLKRQGPDAPGGAYDYLVKGKLYGGYAIIAWPASYGKSGIMTFMTSHDGKIYQRNLGRQTAAQAAAISSFNPDKSWQEVQ